MTPNTSRPGQLVARNFFALGSGEVFARLIAFGATVYLARTLGPASYGVIGFALAVLLYLSRVAEFGIDLTGSRVIAEDPSRIEKLAPTVISLRLLIALGLIFATWAVSTLLPQPDGTILSVYSLTLIATAASARWIYLGMERGGPVALTRTAGEALMALLVVVMVRGPADLWRAPLAQIAGDTIAALLLAIWLSRSGYRIRLGFDWQAAQSLFRKAWPLVLSALLGLVIFNSGLIFLRFFRGAETVGHYAAAYTLVSFLLNLGITYRISLLPTITRLANSHQERRELYHGAMAHLFALACPISLGGFLLAPQIIGLVFGPGYDGAVQALQLLIWSVPLCLLRDVPSAALLASAREDQFFRLTAWGAVLNLALNFALIPRFGIWGAGVATIITETARLFLVTVYVRDQGFRLLGLALFGRLATATLCMTLVLVLARPGRLWAGLLVGSAAYALALVALGAVRLRRGQLPALNL